MVTLETSNGTVIEEDVFPSNFWTKEDKEGSSGENVVNEEKKKPKWRQHGAPTEVELQVVFGAKKVGK